MNNISKWALLNLGIIANPQKEKKTYTFYIITAIIGAVLFAVSTILSAYIKYRFSDLSITTLGVTGAFYIVCQVLGVVFVGLSLSVIPFLALQGSNPNIIVNIIGHAVRIILCILFFVAFLYKYQPLFKFEATDKSKIECDIDFVSDCFADSVYPFVEESQKAKINFSGLDDGKTVFGESKSSVKVLFEENGGEFYAVFSMDEYRSLISNIDGNDKYFDISYYKNSGVVRSWSLNSEHTYEDGTERLRNELLDMDIEITLEKTVGYYNGEDIILIKRPHIAHYDDQEGVIPLDRRIRLLVKKDGVFYDEWDFSYKTKQNKATFMLEELQYEKITEPIKFEFTLVFGYDELTGEYTPVSNTIVYYVDKKTIDHPTSEYESIPLNGTEAEIKGSE
ncbi:MAG: hypothetical protein ACI4JW_00050 [Oscillospiraceae bacterium]